MGPVNKKEAIQRSLIVPYSGLQSIRKRQYSVYTCTKVVQRIQDTAYTVYNSIHPPSAFHRRSLRYFHAELKVRRRRKPKELLSTLRQSYPSLHNPSTHATYPSTHSNLYCAAHTNLYSFILCSARTFTNSFSSFVAITQFVTCMLRRGQQVSTHTPTSSRLREYSAHASRMKRPDGGWKRSKDP